MTNLLQLHLSSVIVLFRSFVYSLFDFMLFKVQLLQKIMAVCDQNAVLDAHEEERILVLSQSTTFGECFSDEHIAYETQLLVLLCSPCVENEKHDRSNRELERKRFLLELDTFKVQFNCEKNLSFNSQGKPEAPKTVPTIHEEMILDKSSVRIRREKIASDILESPAATTMPLSSFFQRTGHKKFSYDEWKTVIQKNIADWKFLDSSVTNSIYDIYSNDFVNPSETSLVRTEIDRLVKTMDEIEANVESLEYALQNLEQNARRNWLVLHGVFEKDKENTLEVMINIVKEKTGLQINPQDVENCHRMGRRRYRNKADPIKMQQNKRPIVIKFVNYCKRKALWDHKKHLRGSGLLLTESLTNSRLELLQTARELFGEKSVWSQDGRIMYRKPDGSKLRINNLDDLRIISNTL